MNSKVKRNQLENHKQFNSKMENNTNSNFLTINNKPNYYYQNKDKDY